MKSINPTMRARQSGFTLIEALVTFLILAIGLLGLAGLQTKGLQFDQSAYQRTQAALLASDIADRMRANVTAAQAGSTGAGGYNIAHGATISSAPDCVASTCSTTNMSQFDIDQWKTALAQLLPSGDGSIVTAANAGATALIPTVDVTITVYWNELRNGASGINCPRLTDADLMCFQLQVTL